MNNKIILSLLLTATYGLSAKTLGTADAELIVGIVNGDFQRSSDALESGANKDLQYGDDQDSAIAQAITTFIEIKLWLSKKLKVEAVVATIGTAAAVYYGKQLWDSGLFGNESEHSVYGESSMKSEASRSTSKKVYKVLLARGAAALITTVGFGGKSFYDLFKGNKKKLNERFNIIELLIANRADVTIKNLKGQSALRVIENCLIEHANDKYLVNAMKTILELLEQNEVKKSDRIAETEVRLVPAMVA